MIEVALPSPVTLRDVARAAGVSIASASRALARPELVSPALRSRIDAVVERLGYVPNLAARRLAGKRSGVIGLLVDAAMDPLTTAAAVAIDRQLGRAGYGVVLASCQDGAEALVRARELLGRGVDALLAWDLWEPGQAIAEIAAKHSIPSLTFGEDGDAVPLGRRRAAALGCRYLQSLGHTRFAAVEVKATAVAAGLRDALAKGAKATVEIEYGTGDLRAPVARLLDRAVAPTAVVCGSDARALAVLRACRALGVEVPERLSVLGFGDSEAGRLAWPSLSSARVFLDDVAAQAIQSLLARLGGDETPPIEPAVKLVVRESTGSAPR